MSDMPAPKPSLPDPPGAGVDSRLREDVARQAQRMVRARTRRRRTVWSSLGLMGMVGWAVALPTLIGTALGAWIDRTWPTGYSWTLSLLVAGAAVGCVNAWRWIERESRHD